MFKKIPISSPLVPRGPHGRFKIEILGHQDQPCKHTMGPVEDVPQSTSFSDAGTAALSGVAPPAVLLTSSTSDAGAASNAAAALGGGTVPSTAASDAAAATASGATTSGQCFESSMAVERLIARVQPLWKSFATFHHECRKTRLLTDAEVESLCKAGTDFVDGVRAAYPGNHIELKLHVIEAHVPSFVRKWRSAGLSLKDGIEHFHALNNRLARRFACLRGEREARSKHDAPTIPQRPALSALPNERVC